MPQDMLGIFISGAKETALPSRKVTDSASPFKGCPAGTAHLAAKQVGGDS